MVRHGRRNRKLMKTSKMFHLDVWRHRVERPNLLEPSASVGSGSGAPSRKGCVVNSQMARGKHQMRAPPHPAPNPPHSFSRQTQAGLPPHHLHGYDRLGHRKGGTGSVRCPGQCRRLRPQANPHRVLHLGLLRMAWGRLRRRWSRRVLPMPGWHSPAGCRGRLEVARPAAHAHRFSLRDRDGVGGWVHSRGRSRDSGERGKTTPPGRE